LVAYKGAFGKRAQRISGKSLVSIKLRTIAAGLRTPALLYNRHEVEPMRKAITASILTIATFFAALPTSAAKLKGTAVLKDSQAYGIKDKQHKHIGYELSFDAEGKSYACRTDQKKSMNATDFVVGSHIRYEIDKNEAKIINAENKKVECEIVRVEIARPAVAQ
jgi:hypothetical protein